MAKIKGPKKTNRYPDEFKIKAVQLADHIDILAKDVAEDLDIHPQLLDGDQALIFKPMIRYAGLCRKGSG